ncbi:ATP-binding protein [Rhodopirellula sp. MGV]|uniref:sensor histidine kinase n=1 Tax=Rhodopirellula sp. MGV TaxID=2023130 RepID=UPI000B95EB89|nr:ATP-binding protein [Rhodopirellula sp. MGV]OYP38252.1 hypothetical protein CGZ80_03285 [Rhodopirellula sp. MGV]PNY38590.1 HAMP domain-containing protein [Rhodopirellula baltica]
MRLTTRVSLFFLCALAAILVAYSLVLYSAGARHVNEQFTGELRSALGALVAAAEVEETEVKWQPLEHSVSMAVDSDYGEIQWFILGDQSRVVELSATPDSPIDAYARKLALDELPTGKVGWTFEAETGFEYFYQRLITPGPSTVPHEPDEFDEILVVVGRSTSQRDQTLNQLAVLVSVLPLLAWIVSAMAGGWFVRKALSPVSQMAKQAQQMGGQDFRQRLEFNESGDELSALGRSFNRLLDRQENAIQQQRRFAGDAAHELRTPMTVLLGQIEVALRKQRTEAEYQRTLETLKHGAETMREIVESLLVLARTENEVADAQIEAIDLRKWLDQHRITWKHWDRADDIECKISPDTDFAVRATPMILSRIVDNLVSNACKYSPPGTPIVIVLSSDRRNVTLTVSDFGEGIPKSDFPHLFEPFYRGDKARRSGHSGTGLGLSIASRLAQSLNATIVCDQSDENGTRFTFTVPLDRHLER